MRSRLVIRLAVLAWGAVTASGCRRAGAATAAAGAEERGRHYIEQWGCGSCHAIPGIHAATGVVAPPLTAFARRSFIAGEVPNTPQNLVRWLMNPQSIEPGTAMPNLGVSEPVARDMATYLERLR